MWCNNPTVFEPRKVYAAVPACIKLVIKGKANIFSLYNFSSLFAVFKP